MVCSWDTINNRNAGSRKSGDERDILVTGEEFAMDSVCNQLEPRLQSVGGVMYRP